MEVGSNSTSAPVSADLTIEEELGRASWPASQDSGSGDVWEAFWSQPLDRPIGRAPGIPSSSASWAVPQELIGEVGDFRVFASPDELSELHPHIPSRVTVRLPKEFRMDLLPAVTDLARHAADTLAHEVRATARPSTEVDGEREVFVEMSTSRATSAEELFALEDSLIDWLLEAYPVAGRHVTVYLKRA